MERKSRYIEIKTFIYTVKYVFLGKNG